MLGIDREFVALQQQVSSFAGAYFVGDTLIVRVSDNRDAERALLTARAWAESKDRPYMHDRVVLAVYSWDRLMQFRRAAGVAVRLGAVSLDADEVNNRIRIGAADEQARGRIRTALIEAGIPDDALEIVSEQPSVEDSCTGGDNILNRCRPAAGGLEIRRTTHGRCTLSYIVQFDGRNGWLTNAHCTPDKFSVDTTYTMYQDSFYIGHSNALGYEYAEHHPFKVEDESSPCYTSTWYSCRTADVAFFVTSGTGATADFSRIYLPTDSMFGFAFNSNDIWEVTSDGSEPAYGTVVIKVGVRRGRVQAPVVATCTDMAQEPYIWSLCQTRAEHPTQTNIEQRGDSGAPVFALTGSGTLKAYGIVWGGGGDEGSPRFNFANMSGIYWGFYWDYGPTPAFF